ncbi:MAG TPA: hypothetical protein VLT36_04465 [Candidatus Dormibacteraeota bacterium]|nr:hypothetical protein [Candidatus Dormibacteraeota bacterium]
MAATPFECSDILVAVHGIGEQSRFSTVQSVSVRLARSRTLLGTLTGNPAIPPVAPQPLGYFHTDVKSLASVMPVDDFEMFKGSDFEKIGFSEVYWADIPEQVLKQGKTLEETKAWARTVVARANALYARASANPAAHKLVKPDFALAGEVLDEIIDTVHVMENLTFLADKAGIFHFDLREVLDQYLGDVQLVTEFADYRKDIVGRFHEALWHINDKYPKANLYIVAHSEGTVVSFLGMLEAMSGRSEPPAGLAKQQAGTAGAAPAVPPWLKQIKGYMTIGSPIDKHLLLWPRLWKDFDPKVARDIPEGQIHWRNYYDYGDPVGFELDTAKDWLKETEIKMFHFPKENDFGFSRYLLPGEAHNEYWNDPDVFEDFIINVVRGHVKSETRPKTRPKTKPVVAALSPTLPYLVSFIVLLLGVFVLYKAVNAYSHPALEPLQRFVRFRELGVKPPAELAGWPLFLGVFGIGALVSGATLLARFPRLAAGARWIFVGLGAFAVGAGLYWWCVPDEMRAEIGARFNYLRRYWPSLGEHAPTVGVLGVAAICGLSGYLVMSQRLGNADRRQRWLLTGMRPLLACAVVGVGLIVLAQIYPTPIRQVQVGQNKIAIKDDARRMVSNARLSSNEVQQVVANWVAKSGHVSSNEIQQLIATNEFGWTDVVKDVQPVLATRPPVWPVVVAGAAFLYLWWLSTLLFDLAFVWQRYTRNATTNKRLKIWRDLEKDWKQKQTAAV